MTLTPAALERMGFRRRREDENLVAAFTSVHVYSVIGLATEVGLLVAQAGEIGGIRFKLAIADSVNAGCRQVAEDDFTDDETAWATEHKCSPPYLLIRLGPTTSHSVAGDYVKDEPFGFSTYGAFNSARRELVELEGRVIPRLVASLSAVFGSERHPLQFEQIERAVQGHTVDGKILFDFTITVSAQGRACRFRAKSELAESIDRAIGLAGEIDYRLAGFYRDALSERDPLKRFLFLFLTIERQTHTTYQSIDHLSYISEMTKLPSRINVTAAYFLNQQPARWTSLRDRFVWCGLTIWTHLTDEDVESFAKLKKIRDKIAHGEITEPPRDALDLVERIAAKLLLLPSPS